MKKLCPPGMCFNRPHADDLACYCDKVLRSDTPLVAFMFDFSEADDDRPSLKTVLTPELIQECWELMLMNYGYPSWPN